MEVKEMNETYVEFMIENNEKLEEERRLLFVATTRAKDYLFVLYSGFYVYYDNIKNCGPSRFFNEIKSMFIDADNFS